MLQYRHAIEHGHIEVQNHKIGQALMNLYPLPNVPNNGSYNYQVVPILTIPNWQHVFRIDEKLTANDSLYFRGAIWHKDTHGPGGTVGYGATSGVRGLFQSLRPVCATAPSAQTRTISRPSSNLVRGKVLEFPAWAICSRRPETTHLIWLRT